ncbi:MAG: 2-dehydro-3-deoxygalactonokinase [Phenylobacterium sp.]|jgi:2-dehydro-3-deoxygalactonokinase
MKQILIDWGSTAFRAYLLNEEGDVVEQKHSVDGVFSLNKEALNKEGLNKEGSSKKRFESFLQRTCADWLALGDCSAGNTKVIMAGMVGSRNGWQEAPYLSCPAGLQALADGLMPVDNSLGLDIRIVPGVASLGVADSEVKRADVMRGEEVQIFGALAEAGLTDGVVCLPGTHSKWAKVTNNAITGFNTFMTGEMFALMNQHSSLASLLTTDDVTQNLSPDRDPELDHDAFIEGLELARQPGGLLNHLFSPRARVLTGSLPEFKARALLSGILIGNEFVANQQVDEVIVVGNSTLLALYATAAEFFAIGSQQIDTQTATVAGLAQITRITRMTQLSNEQV